MPAEKGKARHSNSTDVSVGALSALAKSDEEMGTEVNVPRENDVSARSV